MDINCHVWWDLICCVWVTRAWPLDRVLWTSHRVNGPGPVIHQGSSLQPQGEMSTHFLIKHAEHQISVLNLIMTLSHVSESNESHSRFRHKMVSLEDSFRRALAGPDKNSWPLADPVPAGFDHCLMTFHLSVENTSQDLRFIVELTAEIGYSW